MPDATEAIRDAGTQSGREALDHIDRILAARPRRDGPGLTAAVQCLAHLRDLYVGLRRAEGETSRRGSLDRVNGIISVVMAAEFPIGEMPWDELEKARDWLAAILDDETL